MVTYTTQELVDLLGAQLFGRLALDSMPEHVRKMQIGPLIAASRRLYDAEAGLFVHLQAGKAADWAKAYNAIADDGRDLWKKWLLEHADDRWTPKGGRLAPVE